MLWSRREFLRSIPPALLLVYSGEAFSQEPSAKDIANRCANRLSSGFSIEKLVLKYDITFDCESSENMQTAAELSLEKVEDYYHAQMSFSSLSPESLADKFRLWCNKRLSGLDLDYRELERMVNTTIEEDMVLEEGRFVTKTLNVLEGCNERLCIELNNGKYEVFHDGKRTSAKPVSYKQGDGPDMPLASWFNYMLGRGEVGRQRIAHALTQSGKDGTAFQMMLEHPKVKPNDTGRCGSYSQAIKLDNSDFLSLFYGEHIFLDVEEKGDYPVISRMLIPGKISCRKRRCNSGSIKFLNMYRNSLGPRAYTTNIRSLMLVAWDIKAELADAEVTLTTEYADAAEKPSG
mgnify:CR=1 FL=1